MMHSVKEKVKIVNLCYLTYEALGEGIKLPHLYFLRNISATRKRRDAKLCTQLPKYLAQIVCDFGVDPIFGDVTVTS